MTAPPVQYTNPGAPGYCPPYARYDKVTGALVPEIVRVCDGGLFGSAPSRRLDGGIGRAARRASRRRAAESVRTDGLPSQCARAADGGHGAGPAADGGRAADPTADALPTAYWLRSLLPTADRLPTADGGLLSCLPGMSESL